MGHAVQKCRLGDNDERLDSANQTVPVTQQGVCPCPDYRRYGMVCCCQPPPRPQMRPASKEHIEAATIAISEAPPDDTVAAIINQEQRGSLSSVATSPLSIESSDCKALQSAQQDKRGSISSATTVPTSSGSEYKALRGLDQDSVYASDEPEGISTPISASNPQYSIDTSHPNYVEVQTEEGAYRGQVKENTARFHGRGCLKTPTLTTVGDWQEGRVHGQAQQRWSDGRVYTGQFVNGSFSGKGRMVWKHARGQMVYEGEYLNDKKHGVGNFRWPSGKTYDGQWVNGQRHGIGLDITASGVVNRGLWEDNVFVGPADSVEDDKMKDCEVQRA